ncbi:hypothetical protein [Bradyrhizobium murdochi]|nr:hypothetical protein [Bradyrhizobium murdochi]
MLSLIRTENAWSVPTSMVYPSFAVPVGGALLILHALVQMVVSRLSPGK